MIVDELATLAQESAAVFWKTAVMLAQGQLSVVTTEAADAVFTITSALTACRAAGSTQWVPFFLSYLASVYAEMGQLDDAWRCIAEVTTMIEKTNERWMEAEVNRVAGEIALKSPQYYTGKAEAYFERALAVARVPNYLN